MCVSCNDDVAGRMNGETCEENNGELLVHLEPTGSNEQPSGSVHLPLPPLSARQP